MWGWPQYAPSVTHRLLHSERSEGLVILVSHRAESPLLELSPNDVLSLVKSLNHGIVYILGFLPVKHLSQGSKKTRGFPVQGTEDSYILLLTISR